MTCYHDSVLRKEFLGRIYGSQDGIAGLGPRFPKALCRLATWTEVYVDKRDFKVHFPVETGFATTKRDYCSIMGVVESDESRDICVWCTRGCQYGSMDLGRREILLG
jgi:hypothetical protein